MAWETHISVTRAQINVAPALHVCVDSLGPSRYQTDTAGHDRET